MPSIGHLAVGLAAARLQPAPSAMKTWLWCALLVGVSFAPDVDALAFRLGIPYGAPFGHRGALHSPAVAAITAVAIGVIASGSGVAGRPVALAVLVTMGSHGILDAFTDGGLGVALLWPFSNKRYFAPWRPIPVAPLGWRMVSARGVALLLKESVLFFPLFLIALWPRARASS